MNAYIQEVLDEGSSSAMRTSRSLSRPLKRFSPRWSPLSSSIPEYQEAGLLERSG